jgi:hypothetical protein
MVYQPIVGLQVHHNFNMVVFMVSMRKVEAVVTAMNDGNAAGLKGRLQYLNLQRFPPGFRVGKAKRADYGIDEMLAFSLWFALTKASMTPLTAIALISDFWPEFSRAFLAAAAAAGAPHVVVPRRQETITVISGDALKSPAKTNPDDLRGPAKSFDIIVTTPGNVANTLNTGSGVLTLVDLRKVYAAMVDALKADPYALSEQDLERELISFAAREGWATHDLNLLQPIWIQKKNSYPRGERLSESDYYFSRAIELIDAVTANDGLTNLSPRIARFANYLIEPSPRESWKRGVSVGTRGATFMNVVAALIGATTSIATGVPKSIQPWEAVQPTDENWDVSTMASFLRSSAINALDFEADHEGVLVGALTITP